MNNKQNKDLLLMFYYDGQYSWNIPLLLYYPVGVMYKVPFRYDDCWIPEELQNISEHKLKDAVIAMKFFSKERTADQEYIPIRKVTILNCERVGECSYFYMQLGEFVKYDDSSIFQHSSLFNEKLQRKDSKYLVQECGFTSDLPIVLSDQEGLEIDNWIQITNLINKTSDKELNKYKDTVFLKFHSIYESRLKKIIRLQPIPLYSTSYIKFLHWINSRVPLLNKELYKMYKGITSKEYWGYRFHFGKKYSIKVIQNFNIEDGSTYVFKDAEILLDLPKESCFMLNNSNMIIGHQDAFYYSFNSSGTKSRDSSLVLKLREGNKPIYQKSGNSDSHELKIYGINIPIQVRHTLYSVLTLYVLPILGFLMGSLFVTSATSADVNTHLFDWIENTSYISNIELTIGLLIQGLSLYFLKGSKE